MAKIIDEETKKAWEELVMKKEEKEEEEKDSEVKEEKEKAAEWLTGGGLENEVTSGISAPVLHSNPVPVESLEDVSFAPKKKEEKKETRMYETEGQMRLKYEDVHKREIYEETPENLLGRIVRPRDMSELRPLIQSKMERLRMREEMEESLNPEKALSMKYIERKSEKTTLPFKKSRAEDVDKYEV